MNIALLIYAISAISKLGLATEILSIISGISLCLSSVIYVSSIYDKPNNGRQDNRLLKRIVLWSVLIVVTSTTFRIAIPSEKTAYMILGGYIADKVISNDNIKSNVDNVTSKLNVLVNKKLDLYIKESEESLTKIEKK